MLVGGRLPFLLDMELQQKGEDEVACALRLLGRVLQDFPRAFDFIVADGLYLRASFVRFVLLHGKDAVIVLKDERRDLLQDARGIFRLDPPIVEIEGSIVRRMCDVEGLTSWTAMDVHIRVIRSLETRAVLRQRTKNRRRRPRTGSGRRPSRQRRPRAGLSSTMGMIDESSRTRGSGRRGRSGTSITSIATTQRLSRPFT